MTMTRAAPMNHADFGVEPHRTAPNTTTVSPSVMSPSWAPKSPVASASVSITASSSSIHSGMIDGPTSAKGTRTNSAWPPS